MLTSSNVQPAGLYQCSGLGYWVPASNIVSQKNVVMLGSDNNGQLIPQTNLFFNGLPLTGVTFTSIQGYNLATGTTLLYTSPPGKRTLLGQSGGWNPSAGTITWGLEVTSGSFTQFITTAAVSVSTHTATAATATSIILEPGEQLSVVTATTAGLNITVAATVFDATSPLKTIKLLGLAAGDNTLYTVPTGKTAYVLPAQVMPLASAASVFNTVFDKTDTAIWCAVVAGGLTTCAANSANEIVSSGSQTITVRAATGVPSVTLSSGGFIVVNAATGGTGELAWINVLEF